MCFGELICYFMIGCIIYFAGLFSGAVMIEKSNDMNKDEVMKKAEKTRKERKLKYEKRHLKAEA